MTVYFDKARQRWRYDFMQSGRRYAAYAVHADGTPAANKTEAERCERLARAAAIQQADGSGIPRPLDAMTLAEALAAHATRHKGKAHFENIKDYVSELIGHFGADLPVTAIDEPAVWKYVEWAREQPLMVYVGGSTKAKDHKSRRELFRPARDGRKRTDSTINHYLDCLRAALRLAARTRDPMTGQPRLPIPPLVPELKVPERLPRPIRDADLKRIIASAPPHLADAIVLTILMGFRRAEVFALTVGQVDAERNGLWLDGAKTKGQRDEFVPASAPAMQVLLRLVEKAQAATTEHLITYQRKAGGPRVAVKNPKKAWGRIMRDLGLNHRLHDTKASFVTALAEKVPAHVVKDLARHKDMATTMRYVAIVDEAKRAGVDAIADRGALAGLDLDTQIGRVPHESPTRAQKKQKGPSRRKALSA